MHNFEKKLKSSNIVSKQKYKLSDDDLKKKFLPEIQEHRKEHT